MEPAPRKAPDRATAIQMASPAPMTPRGLRGPGSWLGWVRSFCVRARGAAATSDSLRSSQSRGGSGRPGRFASHALWRWAWMGASCSVGGFDVVSSCRAVRIADAIAASLWSLQAPPHEQNDSPRHELSEGLPVPREPGYGSKRSQDGEAQRTCSERQAG
jgi:hypothetical protein